MKILKGKNFKPVVTAYVIIADTHCGCQLGLCPRDGVRLDEGGTYMPNIIQIGITQWWDEFWGEHVPEMVNKLPYGIIINGDITDGVHHKATHQISHNLADQKKIAETMLAPLVEKCEGRLYIIRGTEAHTGPSGENEETIAKSLGAVPNKYGQYARYELWKTVGHRGLIHITHHIGSTSSQAYESTAVNSELVTSYAEAARWGTRPPDMAIRSHRHRYIKVEFATKQGRGCSIVTPGWQAKTPFIYRTNSKASQPQFGGIVVIESPQGELYTRQKVWNIERPEAE